MKCDPLIDIVNQINNEKIRNFTIAVLNAVPDDFWTMKTSTSGKYHPPECNEVGGLIIHIQRACYFGSLFINANGWDSLNIRGDILLSALLLHDIGKREKYDKYWDYVNHPISGSKMLYPYKHMLPEKVFVMISNCVLHHMNRFGPKTIQKPDNKYNILELYTYQADYLASQKSLKIGN